MLGAVLDSGAGAGAGVGAGFVSACATGRVGASVVGDRVVVWFCGAVGVVGAGCTELVGTPAGVFTGPVGAGVFWGVVTEGVVGAKQLIASIKKNRGSKFHHSDINTKMISYTICSFKASTTKFHAINLYKTYL